MNIFRTFLIAGSLVFSVSSNAQILDERIKITLESPQYDHHIGQIGSVRGWAFHPTQYMDVVEIYIDGELWSEVPVGGKRTDVYNAYPTALNSEYSGWAQTINFKDFAEGYHTLEVVAYTTAGRYNSVTGKFCVEKVPGGNFISDSSKINFKTMDLFHMAKNALLLQKITIDGEFYNMELHWDTATQGFIVEQVEPYVSKTDLEDSEYEGWCTLCKPSI